MTTRRQPGTPRLIARLPLLVLTAALFLTGRTSAQEGAFDPPGAEDAMHAWNVVDRWTRDWAFPTELEFIDPARTAGACITIRLSGRVVGRGVSVRDDGAAIWDATKRAHEDAVSNAVRDNLGDLADLAPLMTVELELAGRLRPLAGDTFSAAAAPIMPGTGGVAARAGERTDAMFPGVMLATSTSPEEAIRAAVAGLDIVVGAADISRGKLELAKLRSQHDLAVYRFRTIHLAQSDARSAPIFLHRGGRVVPDHVRSQLILSTADGIARHLMSHDWPASEQPRGMTGPYLPWLDEYTPFEATPLQQALTAWSLLRYAKLSGVDPATSEQAHRFAVTLIEELLIPVVDNENPALCEPDPMLDPVAVAMMLVADAEAEDPMLPRTTWLNGVSLLRETVNVRERWNALRPHDQAMIAFGLAAVGEVGEETDEYATLARDAAAALLARTDRGEMVSVMPWLGWTLLRVADKAEPLGAAVALRDMRSLTWSFQLSRDDTGLEDADLSGGIVFTRGRTMLPTWQSVRPLAFIATMLGDERLTTEEERNDEIVRLLRSLRFLIQLTIRQGETWFCVDQESAIGGVRASLWDATQPIEANCLGLLTLCEAIESARSFR